MLQDNDNKNEIKVMRELIAQHPKEANNFLTRKKISFRGKRFTLVDLPKALYWPREKRDLVRALRALRLVEDKTPIFVVEEGQLPRHRGANGKNIKFELFVPDSRVPNCYELAKTLAAAPHQHGTRKGTNTQTASATASSAGSCPPTSTKHATHLPPSSLVFAGKHSEHPSRLPDANRSSCRPRHIPIPGPWNQHCTRREQHQAASACTDLRLRPQRTSWASHLSHTHAPPAPRAFSTKRWHASRYIP